MKDLKISKELINEVLEKETETLSKDFIFTINEDYIEFSDDGEMQFEYCVYKFAFKCKEWAIKSNSHSSWELRSFCNVSKIWECHCNPVFQMRNYGDIEIFKTDTEIEAIVKACEWILSEVNK